jgi:pyridoxal phosphate enzyme (YggS family)
MQFAYQRRNPHAVGPAIMVHYEKAWQGVLERIARAAESAGRDPASVRLVAVSKTFPPDAIRAVHALGQRAFGENYVQEALAKMDALADLADVEWHLIGPVQGNKARAAATRFAWVHTIDRLRIAERLSAARSAEAPPLEVCVQVNVSGEASKSGVVPGEAVALAQAVAALPRLRLRGFMAIPAPGEDAQRTREQFRLARECLVAAQAVGLPVDTLSMGMSADLDVAIAEGATLVRIGTAIFGERSA